MDCDQALELLLAAMDREPGPEDRERLAAHLRACAGCRASADAFRLQDADLRRAFAPRRRAAALVADRVIAQLRAWPVRTRLAWWPLLAAAAAGFLLAVLIFRPWQKASPSMVQQQNPGPRRERPEQPPPAPHHAAPVLLALASKAVEVQTAGQQAWQPLEAGGTVALGTWVRTPAQVRCEFRLPDGSEVRLDGATELEFEDYRQLRLARGQILTRVARAASSFQVAIPGATVTALGTEFDIDCKPATSVLTVIEGSTRVEGVGTPLIVPKGYRTQIRDGRASKPQPVLDLVRSIDWADEILCLKGRENPELAHRVEDILAQIGEAKMQLLPEQDIRRLGDHCVVPLTRFLESQRSQADAEKRHRAARLVADLAQPWSIPDLLQLLGDADGEVRYEAARGLRRLTHLTFGVAPEQWRQRTQQTEKALQEWQGWWQENEQRYPRPPR